MLRPIHRSSPAAIPRRRIPASCGAYISNQWIEPVAPRHRNARDDGAPEAGSGEGAAAAVLETREAAVVLHPVSYSLRSRGVDGPSAYRIESAPKAGSQSTRHI